MVQFEHSETAEAIYIRLRDLPYAYGKDLDDDRRVDYAANGEVVGVELLGVREGVHTDDLPQRDAIIRALEAHKIPLYA